MKLLVCFLFLPSMVFASKPFEKFIPVDLDDRKQVEKIDKNLFIVGGYLEFPTYSFYFGPPDEKGRAYVPNANILIGPSIVYKRMGLRWGVPIQHPSRETQRRGRTQQTSFVFSFYWEEFAVDFSYQDFDGFYLGSPLLEVEENKPNRYAQLPNAESKQWNLNLYYNVNPSKYSLSSAFDSTDDKVQSGQSWILVPFYRHWEFDLGDRVLPGTGAENISTLPNLVNGRFDTLGASIAYAVTETKKRFYVTGLVGLGPALQLQEYTEGDNESSQVRPAAKVNLNATIGVKKKKYNYGAKASLDTIYTRVSRVDVYSSVVLGELFIGSRF